MQRFTGQELQPGANIAVVANDAIGNFVVATPLAQMLRARYQPARLDLWSGLRSRELADASPLWTASFAPFGANPGAAHQAAAPHAAAQPAAANAKPNDAWHATAPHYHLVINLEWSAWAKQLAGQLSQRGSTAAPAARVPAPASAPGPAPVTPTFLCGPATDRHGADIPFAATPRDALWQDQAWVAEDLSSRYPFLRTGWIAEIFCRAAWQDGPVPHYQVPQHEPNRAIPDLLIACSASLPDKLWPVEHWRTLLQQARAHGLSAGLLGAARTSQGAHWLGADAEDTLVDEGLAQDLRGAFTLPQVVGALAQARAVLTLDNGIMHLAASTRTPTTALFRHGIHRLWAPPSTTLHAAVAPAGQPVSAIPPSAVAMLLFSSVSRGEERVQ